MKNISILLALLLIIPLSAITQSTEEDKDQLRLEKCAELYLKGHLKIEKFEIDIKSRKDLSEETTKRYISLTRGETYVISICSLDDNLVVSLFDHKDNFIISSYNEDTEKTTKKITFKCNATNKYCLTYFLSTKKNKASGIISIGMKKKGAK